MRSGEYYESVRPSREAWKKSVPHGCMWCGDGSQFLEIHEMVRRSSAPRSWGRECNYLLLGGGLGCGCHEKVDSMSLTQQLAVKFLRDLPHYHLEGVMEISPRRGICQEDVETVAAALNLPPIRSSTPMF